MNPSQGFRRGRIDKQGMFCVKRFDRAIQEFARAWRDEFTEHHIDDDENQAFVLVNFTEMDSARVVHPTVGFSADEVEFLRLQSGAIVSLHSSKPPVFLETKAKLESAWRSLTKGGRVGVAA